MNLPLAVLYFGLFAAAAACGFTVHMLNSHRALSTLASTPQNPAFMDVLYENTGAVFAGSPYPDYLYECGSNGDDGEYTHWTGFQVVASRYIRATYPAPRNATGDTLVAFLAGVASHYYADVAWHGLGPPHGNGLIQSIGVLDFGTGEDLDMRPHSFADTGGEFAAVYENVVPWDDPNAWVIPLQDLLNIYAIANRSDVNASSIEECAAIFYAGAEAVAAAAALADPILEQASPTFAEHLTTLPMGGWDDMAVGLSRIWGRLSTWVGDRAPPTHIPGNEYCNARNPCGATGPAAAAAAAASHGAAAAAVARRRSELAATQAAYRALGPAVLAAGLVRVARAPDGALLISRAPGASPSAVLAAVASSLRGAAAGAAGARPAAAAGWTAPAPADADADAVAARVAAALRLPASARRAGALGVAAALEALGAAPPPPAARARSPHAARAAALPSPAPVAYAAASAVDLEYTGAALAAGDFSGAGARDLIITAYGASPVGAYVDDALGVAPSPPVPNAVLPQAGGYYRRSGGPAAAARAAARAAAGDGPEPLSPADRSEGASVFARLGEAACVVDFNADGVDDLVLGAPTAGWAYAADPWAEAPNYFYQGRVEVFYGVRGRGLPAATAPDVTILPAANVSLLGAVLFCDVDLSGDGLPDVVVGSPQWGPSTDFNTTDGGNDRQRGHVDVYFAGAHWPARVSLADANVTLPGALPYSWHGTALAGWPDASALGVTPAEYARAAVGAAPGESLDAALARAPAACGALAAAALAAPAASGALLLVGAPGFSPALNVSRPPYPLVTGRLFGYALPAAASPAGALAACARAPPAPLFTLTADAGLGVTATASPKLGAAAAVGLPLGPAGGPHLAVGMPDVDLCNSTALAPSPDDVFKTAAGAVAVVQLSPALRGDLAWSALPARARLQSALPDARFGLRVRFRRSANASVPDDLLVGAPLYSRLFLGGAPRAGGGGGGGGDPAPTPAGDSGREAGALFAFRAGAAFPSGTLCAAEAAASWWAEGRVQHGRLGLEWAFYDWDGDGAEELVVAAPRGGLAPEPAARAAAAAAAGRPLPRARAGGVPENAGVLQVYNY